MPSNGEPQWSNKTRGRVTRMGQARALEGLAGVTYYRALDVQLRNMDFLRREGAHSRS